MAMDPVPPVMLGAIDRWQRRRRWPGFVVGVGRKYLEDGAARDGARVAYYAFFSVFPLMLAFVSILGFVLEDRPELRQDILDSTYAEMPVLGPFIRSDIESIGGSGIGLAVGIAVALWAGLGVTVAFGQALDRIWGVAPVEQPAWLTRRMRGLAVLMVGGGCIVASSILAGTATTGHPGPWGVSVATVLGSVIIDVIVLMAAFRVLTAARSPLRGLLPGAVVAAVGLLVLQALGAAYVEATTSRGADTYGLFATVIGLLSWLSIAAQLVLVSAEVNAVRVGRLWPRSLSGATTPADRVALEQYARAAVHDARETITVSWPSDDGPDVA